MRDGWRSWMRLACPGLQEDQDMQHIPGAASCHLFAFWDLKCTLHVLVFGKTRTCNTETASEYSNQDQDMHAPNSPLGVACPGPPENQDMQPLPESRTSQLCIKFIINYIYAACSAVDLGFACPGSQENQDMQHPTARWGYACPDPALL